VTTGTAKPKPPEEKPAPRNKTFRLAQRTWWLPWVLGAATVAVAVVIATDVFTPDEPAGWDQVRLPTAEHQVVYTVTGAGKSPEIKYVIDGVNGTETVVNGDLPWRKEFTLKVGPGLTFAMREALWALDAMDQELTPASHQACLRDTVLERMRRQPKYWERYYHGNGQSLAVDLQYSLSDRVRYYWPDPVIEQARVRLFDNLRATPPPISLISQHLPLALHAVREGTATRDPLSLAVAHVSAVLDDYHHACHTH